MAAAKNYHHLIVLRILVGVFEAGFAPGMLPSPMRKITYLTATGILLIISSWYKKNEQSKRFAVYISAAVLSGAFGGILAGAITGGLDGAHGLEGWRWLFIVEGVATSGFALIAGFILLDFPATTKKFTARERALAIARLASDNVQTRSEDSPDLTHLQALTAALRDWRTWIMV
jgi:MFS family permease